MYAGLDRIELITGGRVRIKKEAKAANEASFEAMKVEEAVSLPGSENYVYERAAIGGI